MSQNEPDDSEPIAPIDPTDSIQNQLDRARARHGTIGAMVFSAMLGVDKVLGRKPKDEGAVIWEASGEPEDIDADGITIDVDDQTKVVSHLTTDKTARRVRKKRTVK
ncbi:MAG: hypothetical protein NWR75_06460 [Ilumatobacteraceae bacterium]|jgi:hypothetical protein|nr:hypothetical protein [Ilumatobacteraceae bacterium]